MATVLAIMGVAGCGKTTVGRALAARLGWRYCEGDDFHPAANKAKMHAGQSLDDADREPWLSAIAGWMDAQTEADQPGMVACSALKRRYRDFLRDGRPQVWFLYLRVPYDVLQRRVEARHHPYMPASLLDSQLATFEEPQAGEPGVLTIEAGSDVATTVTHALDALREKHVIGERMEQT